ncbi:MAG: DUF1549 domain-containing protein [Verrucomicrobiales bacterium]|nr:DUF1549 domain-containing protein [Verrucomicrobiales bacterium]
MRKILSASITSAFLATAQAEVDFVHQVVPILKEHCSECHSGAESKGGFSMNTRALFIDDETAVPGKSHESYFIDLIHDSDPDYQMPPGDYPRMPADQIAMLEMWVNEGMKWEEDFTFGTPTYEPPFLPRRPKLPTITGGTNHPLDRLIDEYLLLNDLEKMEPVDDSTFIRRVTLDLTGLLPGPDRVRSFCGDTSPGKRQALIDELLADDLAYTEHWLTFWNDLLRNDYTGTGFITGGRTQISEWLYQALKENKPFDTMVQELIAPADSASAGFINGIKWRGTVSAGQTLPVQFSQSLSQAFLGINMKCASCHDSFLDRWTLDDAYGLAAIYSDDPLELHRCDKPTGATAKANWIFPEIGNINPAAGKEERLSQLAGLMTHPENGRVPRTIVNRLWGQLMGRGMVHPLDAMQTEPWNEDLLDWIASDFQDNGYDLKHTLRLITTSAAYQSKSVPQEEINDAESYQFRGPHPKRLTAEQFVDAIWQITGNAPASYDAPVARGVIDPALIEQLSFESSWIWGPSARPGPPPHGEKILLRKNFSPNNKVRSAGIIAAADNAYVLYLNGQKILDGSQWNELDAAPVANSIKQENQLLIVAENRGAKPNAAGAFCAVRIEYEDNSDEIVMTDETWQVSQSVPPGSRPGKWNLDELTWTSSVSVNVPQWKSATDKRIGKTLARASAGSDRPVRASLLKADELMRALGRPNRDQIVTSRPSELTTLEAVNLATNGDLVANLKKGAEKLIRAFPAEKLVESIYLSTLSRYPAESEENFASGILGDSPDTATVTDLLWAITMTPEFLIVR